MTEGDPPITLRPLTAKDAVAALALYTELTFGPPASDADAVARVCAHPGTTIIGAFDGAKMVGMVTLHLLPNVTWGARPYGLIENVITTQSHRRRGIGKTLLARAAALAWEQDAYKLMLMTGKKRGVAGFYESAGFSSEDKTAMVIRKS